MKYFVKVGDRTYHVEIENLNTRPIIATVDGVQFEVQPEEGGASVLASAPPAPTSLPEDQIPASGAVPSGAVLDIAAVRAPIPGVIIEVKIKPGEIVEFGQPLFIIEAMKMRNSIRAARSGTVGEVFVSTGETVSHNQELMCFTE